MATLQERNGSYRVLFYWAGERQNFTIGRVTPAEAETKASQVDYLLMRVKQGLLTIPDGVSVTDFVAHDGKPPLPAVPTAPPAEQISLGQLRDRYLKAQENSLEATSIAGMVIHFGHLVKALGEDLIVQGLTLANLQDYVTKRSTAKGWRGRKLSPVTIKKEIVTLRTAWNWAVPTYLTGRFPNKGLKYPKGTEKLPFMTYEEIERRGDGQWDCLYLCVDEIVELLAGVKAKKAQPFVYPMVCFAAHTGARRSEIIRCKITDLDFASGVITLHEKKRDHTKTTTRRVPMSGFLAGVLKAWLKVHPGGPYLFCMPAKVERSRKKTRTTGPLTKDEFHDHLIRSLRGSKWSILKGAHTFRHSFISALASKGVDQRIIDEFVGHQSEEQRRRYRHLYPNVKQEALASVFG